MLVGPLVLLNGLLLTSIMGFPMNLLENPKLPSPAVLDFLKKFGYIEDDDDESSALYTPAGISETLKVVQKFGGLQETGILDNATLALMSTPRCGVPDVIRTKRQKRYALGSKGWNKRTISFFIANWSPRLGEEYVARIIQMALDTWGKYGRLNFEKKFTPDADIIVAFGSSYHGDKYPFDGPGNILAHAFFPYEEQGFGGDIHFDADENWIDRKTDEYGMDFATVALHELGHSLGLSHSAVPDSVMFPYYVGYDPNGQMQLGYDDILGMYELYIRRNIKDDGNDSSTTNTDAGSGFSTTSTEDGFESTTNTSGIFTTEISTSTSTEFVQSTTLSSQDSTLVVYTDDHKDHDPKHSIPSTNSPSFPNICDGYFDAVAALRGEIFIFKDQYIWRLKQMGRVEQGYPRLIHQLFSGLPKTIKKIDAAYERPDGMIVLFTGDTFWVHDGRHFTNSPRPLIDYGLPITVQKVDAVQSWARNGKTYIYTFDRFWRYNETSKSMDDGYPRHMEVWKGVPQDLDAATTWNGVTYFFKDELYWTFDNNWVIVTDQSPLPSPQIWLGCPEDNRTLSRILRDDF